MKKFIAIALVAASVCAFAAFDAADNIVSVVAVAPTTITTATNSVVTTVAPLKGICGVYATAAANVSRTKLDVAIYNTNAVSGGWSLLTRATSTDTNAVVVVAPFPGEYVTKDVKITVASEGSASAGSAIVLGTK